MDVSAYMDIHHAARVVFNALPARRSRVRFMVPDESGTDWRAITWGAFAAEIEEIGVFLAGAGLKSSERAAILGYNCVEWLSAALAIQGAGGAMVPIYPSSTSEQVAYVVEHSDARVVFVDHESMLRKLLESWGACSNLARIVALNDSLDPAALIERMREEGAHVPSFSEVEPKFINWSRARELGRAALAESPNRFHDLMDQVSLDQPAVMLYTSGTTGRPKGVPLTHRNIGVNGRDWLTCNAPLLEEGYVDMLWLPLSHIFGFGEACLGNTLGFVTYWVQPHAVLDMLPVVRPQVFMSVPRVFEKIAVSAMGEPTPALQRARLDEVTGGDFRFCLSGGAGLKQEVKEFLYSHDVLVIEGYGLTEASPTLTLNRAGAFRFDSVGKPLPSVELKLAEDGEILARGESIFGGYHKDAGATKDTFTEDGWLKTGDIGRWTDDGFLQIIDRKKEIIVTAQGKNVPPANIEIRFRDDPFIAHVVVYGDARPYLVAGVWLNEGAIEAHLDGQGVEGEAARAEARRGLVAERVERANQGLARFETIKKFAIIDAPLTVEGGMLTPTLKVKRKKVYEAHGDTLQALYDA